MLLRKNSEILSFILLLGLVLGSAVGLCARNKRLTEIKLDGKSSVEKSSGVWVDGQYVGYLEELKGDKKILVAPGEHQISVRQGGYLDFNRQVTVAIGQKQQKIKVAMERNTGILYPKVTAEVKMTVYPLDAAVFVDGIFMGHVDDFDGLRGLLVAPGPRKITISLPGYHSFDTVLDLAPHQQLKLMTNLIWAGENAR
ncbi:MAG TPA: PEGA domain-containing protein [Terriglobales bacterium]|nr:PEGA domain-containing protein [Terriglobales bacterium]